LWLRVSPRTIYRAIDRGELNAVRAGAQIRIAVEEVERWLLETPAKDSGEAA
jgi:excisionase family DNA binding protein